MSEQRLYKAAIVELPGDGLEDWERELLGPYEPEGWREYALMAWPDGPREGEVWPDGHKPFFWPSTDRIFRSRSSAQARVDIINHWGGRAVLVECTPEWMTVSAANAQRKAKRLKAKRARVLEELNAVTDALRAVEAVA